MYTKKDKLLAILACLAIIFVALFSAIFVGLDLHHDCSGHDCSVCASIHYAESIIRSISLAIVKTASLAAITAVFIIELLVVRKSSLPSQTLVSQKVRLDN